MKVRTHVFSFHFIGAGGDGIALVALNDMSAFFVVSASRDLRSFPMVAKKVFGRRQRARGIERMSGIGNREEYNAAGAQHTQVVLQGSKRILDMLEHMVRDDEIEGRVRDRAEPSAVINYVWVYERLAFSQHLSVRRFESRPVEIVNVADSGLSRHAHRKVERADLDAVPTENASGDILTVGLSILGPPRKHRITYTALPAPKQVPSPSSHPLKARLYAVAYQADIGFRCIRSRGSHGTEST